MIRKVPFIKWTLNKAIIFMSFLVMNVLGLVLPFQMNVDHFPDHEEGRKRTLVWLLYRGVLWITWGSVWRRDCLTFPWNSFLNVCVVLLYGCSIPFGIETFYFGVGVKCLDAKIRTRSEEGNCLVHPAMATLAPLCFHISVSWETLDALQQVYISRAPMAWRHFSIMCLQDVGQELSSAPSVAKASIRMKPL